MLCFRLDRGDIRGLEAVVLKSGVGPRVGEDALRSGDDWVL